MYTVKWKNTSNVNLPNYTIYKSCWNYEFGLAYGKATWTTLFGYSSVELQINKIIIYSASVT